VTKVGDIPYDGKSNFIEKNLQCSVAEDSISNDLKITKISNVIRP
jgi:hypothetical protein